MRELILHPGLRFYIFKLSGVLKYTLTITHKPPRHFELSDADFEDVLLQVKEGTSAVPIGPDTSAVDIALKLVKNDGTINMKFEGRDGSMAEWKFDGLTEVRERAAMYATASMQTMSAVTADIGVQTRSWTSINKQAQPEEPSKHATPQTIVTGLEIEGVLKTCGQKKAAILPVSRSDHSSQTNIVTLQSATLSISTVSKALTIAEEIKRQIVADEWPRYMQLSGSAMTPGFPSNYGYLFIDRYENTLTFVTDEDRETSIRMKTRSVSRVYSVL
jgi:hypothetical protein